MDTIPAIVCSISFDSPVSGQSGQQPTGTYSFILGQISYSGCSGEGLFQAGSALSGFVHMLTGGSGGC